MKRHSWPPILISLLILGASCSSAVHDGTERSALEADSSAMKVSSGDEAQKESVVEEARPEEPVRPANLRPRSNAGLKPAPKTVETPSAPSLPVVNEVATVDRTVPEPVASPSASVPLPNLPKMPPPPTARPVTIPAGTSIALRMIDNVTSDESYAGQTFRASLAEDVRLDDEIIIRSGAKAVVKLVHVSSAGEFKGRSELELQLDSISVAGKTYPIESDVYLRQGDAQGARTARAVGIGAAVGAAIGAITGGKKGAIIGAGTGAGSGAVIEAVREEQIRIDSESRIDFRLAAPLEIELPLAASSPASSGSRAVPARLGERLSPPSP
jgi:hypothetical protein